MHSGFNQIGHDGVAAVHVFTVSGFRQEEGLLVKSFTELQVMFKPGFDSVTYPAVACKELRFCLSLSINQEKATIYLHSS